MRAVALRDLYSNWRATAASDYMLKFLGEDEHDSNLQRYMVRLVNQDDEAVKPLRNGKFHGSNGRSV